jgi:hypothetical protein
MRAAASCDSLSDASTEVVNASVITKRTSQGLSASHDQNSLLSRCGKAEKGACDAARSNQPFASSLIRATRATRADSDNSRSA